MTPYITSSFYRHSLTAYTGVMSGIIGGVLKLPLAKILDIFGRPQGYGITIAFLNVGLIMMAVCNNVQTYAAAQIFYWIGYNGIAFIIGILVADTSHLKNRGFMFAYVSSPYIITVWITGPLTDAFVLNGGPGCRWFYGAFAIITVAVNPPLLALSGGTTVRQFAQHYIIEFDVGGLFLLMGGLVFFLLPFSLWSYQDGRWNSPLVIAFLIIGGLMLIGFALFEKFVAPKTFIPYELLLDRTVLVVSGLNITKTSYVTNIYSIGACFWSLVVGLLIRWTGRFKWLALYFGVPVTMLGTGLMVHFRQPDVDVGWIIMSQIFIAFAGGAIVITEQIAAMAATTHQYVAVILAIEGMFSSVGGAIRGSVSAAIWTGVFPTNLTKHLPAEAQANLLEIYASLPVQLSYPKGTPIRYAIEQAYGESQKWMAVASTAILVIAFGAVLMWRDVNVKDYKQVKGRVLYTPVQMLRGIHTSPIEGYWQTLGKMIIGE
ncbi:hypothetical protein E8E11_009499 [Didymella keratinophila]|nr:hypothetical protein E8E11_009499 [Didymella keratinophila]